MLDESNNQIESWTICMLAKVTGVFILGMGITVASPTARSAMNVSSVSPL
jgi:hypothetical protein